MKAGKFLRNEFMRLLMPDGQLAFMADVCDAQHLWRMAAH
jgi:hypothetical protein